MTDYIQALTAFLIAIPFVYMMVDVAVDLSRKVVRIKPSTPRRKK